eukprot:3363740-Pleurochrysis_carterae.AAC.2
MRWSEKALPTGWASSWREMQKACCASDSGFRSSITNCFSKSASRTPSGRDVHRMRSPISASSRRTSDEIESLRAAASSMPSSTITSVRSSIA